MVIDLYSRRVAGWSMQGRQPADVVLQALIMAVCRRKPKNKVLIHSNQGSQLTSMDWAAFLRGYSLEHLVSRRGNCHDNAVAESFFNLLKRERIRRRTCGTREDARQDVFDYIEVFCNRKRKQARNGRLRNGIDIIFGRLRDWGGGATRYDRCPKAFLSAIALALSSFYWL